MSAIYREPALSPGLTGFAPAFSFYEQADCLAPAPSLYEAWRVQDIIGAADGWFYCKPTAQLIEAIDYTDAIFKVDWSREMVGLHERCMDDGLKAWQHKRPWWI